jgi:hypothetical protein
MTIMQTVKGTVKALDKLSPYPFFYSIAMSKDEIAAFDRAIAKSKNYLEFGLGGSTLRAIQKSRGRIYTVESSPEWITRMREYVLVRYMEKRRLFISPVNIGPIHIWGYPESDQHRESFPVYSSSIFKTIDTTTIDRALVDGRFRVACTLKIVLECHANSNLEILIHDFWDREEYHVVLKYLDTLERVDTLGVFSIKTNVDLESAKRDYEIYKFNPT